MPKKQVIVCTGGGTVGHVNPALEVVDHIRALHKNIEVVWIGSKSGIERAVVGGAGIAYRSIPCGKFRRYFSLRNISDLFLVVAGIVWAFFHLSRLSADMIFSKGGYVTVPVVIAGAILRIPVISHESDISPGLATKINSRFSRHLCLAHKKSMSYIAPARANRVIVSGNPIRRRILEGDRARGHVFLNIDAADYHRPVALFMGGSLGAQQINALVADIGLSLMAAHNCIIVHQHGAHSHPPSALEESPHYISFAYIDREFGDVLSLADVVVGRAGANSLWECAALRKTMILIPLSEGASRGDQIINAELFAHHNAAMLLRDPTPAALLQGLSRLLTNKEHAQKMGERARALITHDATERLYRVVMDTLGVSE